MPKRSALLFTNTSTNAVATEDNIEAEMKAFGQRLLAHCTRLGWNQSELARRAKLGRYSISGYVRGKVMPTAQSVKAIADALGVNHLELISPGVVASKGVPQAPPPEVTGNIVSMTILPEDPSNAEVHVKAIVPTDDAVKIIQTVNAALTQKRHAKTK